MLLGKVNMIRPDSLEESKKEAIKKDEAWIAAHQTTFVDGHCPLCGRCQTDKAKKYIKDNGICYIICPSCGTLFQKKHPDENGYRDFYRESEVIKFFSEKIFRNSQTNRKRFLYEPRLKRLLSFIDKYASEPLAYYEVGAGSGQFAAMARDSGRFTKTVAIEPNGSLAADCRALNLEVWENTIEEIQGSISGASIVASFECLEHLTDPASHLHNLGQIMCRGSLLVITTPNGKSLEVMELGAHSTTLGFTHVHIFNPYSICKLLEKNGFDILNVCTPGILDVDLVQRGIEEFGEEICSPFIIHLLKGGNNTLEEFQEFLVNNNFSSHMWVVAQKK